MCPTDLYMLYFHYHSILKFLMPGYLGWGRAMGKQPAILCLEGSLALRLRPSLLAGQSPSRCPGSAACLGTCCSLAGLSDEAEVGPSSHQPSSIFLCCPKLQSASSEALRNRLRFPIPSAFILFLTEDSSPSLAAGICAPTEPH